MINWIAHGFMDLRVWSQQFFIIAAVLVWYLMVRHHLDLKKERRLLLRVGFWTGTGAAISPLLIMVFQGKLFYMVSNIDEIVDAVSSIDDAMAVFHVVNKGVSITGALFFLVLALLLVRGAQRVTFPLLYPFPLFAGIARLGCFTYGCCFGRVTERFPAVVYPPGSQASIFHFYAYDTISRFIPSQPVHPVQLYITFSMLLLFLLLFFLKRRGVNDIRVSAVSVAGYAMINFNIEFIRQEPYVLGKLTMGQVMELAMVVFAVFLWRGMFNTKESVSPSSDDGGEK